VTASAVPLPARRRRGALGRSGTVLAVCFLAGLAIAALAADHLPLDAFGQDLAAMLEGPSRSHPFGTDELGRDILARVVHGARTSLLTALGAVAIAAAIGVPVGLVAGFFGGWRDAVLMRAVDVLLALPGILFAMVLIAILGRSQFAALVAVGITGVPGFARVTRAEAMRLRARDFVAASRALGSRPFDTMARTVLPNAWSPILVQAVVLVSFAILVEAALAFLGVGIPPPTPSWGEMLRTGKEYLYEAPTYAVLPGLALTLTILAFDTLGRALATWLEAREAGAAP
jgi:peptide/nickel transport system permease protein